MAIINRKFVGLALAFGLAGGLAVACQTQQTAEEEVDPRVGKSVSQVCFTNQITSWEPKGDRAVVIEMNAKKLYKLSLTGTCRPEDALTQIGVASRGASSCLTRGDVLVTDKPTLGGPCYINGINEYAAKEKSAT